MQINNYWKITVVVNNMFRRQKTLKKRIKLYSTLAHTALLYGRENWARDTMDKRRLTAAETKYMSNTA